MEGSRTHQAYLDTVKRLAGPTLTRVTVSYDRMYLLCMHTMLMNGTLTLTKHDELHAAYAKMLGTLQQKPGLGTDGMVTYLEGDRMYVVDDADKLWQQVQPAREYCKYVTEQLP
jgi:hypothetical protein